MNTTDPTEKPPVSQRHTDAVDRHIGRRIREQRVLRGISQAQLAKTIGVTYQQLQKYERGQNRVFVNRLYLIAMALSMPVDWFFEGIPEDGDASAADEDTHGALRLQIAQACTLVTDERQLRALLTVVHSLTPPTTP